ncbi:ESX-1 secretion-associated protein [Mycolicibacterium sediminis]|uniref:ESX-1 secretion-associated protein n=1 Tax=Mycolicibacterium sediminis TaxID=1286180 RepID=A0A7I7QLT2_9MYCO|nr:ESX-1 secretion-associated protein [Mycolicibacterium sediminis]BBY27261.1 ESX-1 secretion-associated protein [Mycolicibacterium sediminis]
MSSGVRVMTAHLRQLSAAQRRAAAEIKSATGVTHGVDESVRVSHGVIAWSTANAVESANRVRRATGRSMERASDALGDDLGTAAGRYDDTDRRTAGRIAGLPAHARFH